MGVATAGATADERSEKCQEAAAHGQCRRGGQLAGAAQRALLEQLETDEAMMNDAIGLMVCVSV